MPGSCRGHIWTQIVHRFQNNWSSSLLRHRLWYILLSHPGHSRYLRKHFLSLSFDLIFNYDCQAPGPGPIQMSIKLLSKTQEVLKGNKNHLTIHLTITIFNLPMNLLLPSPLTSMSSAETIVARTKITKIVFNIFL